MNRNDLDPELARVAQALDDTLSTYAPLAPTTAHLAENAKGRARRNRRRRRSLASAGLLATVALFGGAAVAANGLAGSGGFRAPVIAGDGTASPSITPGTVASTTSPVSARGGLPDGLLGELSAAGRNVKAAEVLASAAVGDDRLVLLATGARQQEAAQGGKAAQLFVSRGAAPFRMLSDYLSYDLACEVGDAVCKRVRPTGLGLAAVWRERDRSTVLLALDDGRRPHVRTAEGGAVVLSRADRGYVGTTRTGSPLEVGRDSYPGVWQLSPPPFRRGSN